MEYSRSAERLKVEENAAAKHWEKQHKAAVSVFRYLLRALSLSLLSYLTTCTDDDCIFAISSTAIITTTTSLPPPPTPWVFSALRLLEMSVSSSSSFFFFFFLSRFCRADFKAFCRFSAPDAITVLLDQHLDRRWESSDRQEGKDRAGIAGRGEISPARVMICIV